MLSSVSRQSSRIMIQASRDLTRNPQIYQGLYRSGTIYASTRYKTYLVGVDGSEYGYNALRAVCKGANKTDKIVAMYFPTSVAV